MNPPPKSRNIIVIDDDPLATELIRAVLRTFEERYEVLGFQDPLKGIRYLRHVPPEPLPLLVILDYQMPGLNGLQVAQELRKLRHLDSVNIYILSGHFSPVNAGMLPSGVKKAFQKPGTLEELAEIVTGMIRSATD